MQSVSDLSFYSICLYHFVCNVCFYFFCHKREMNFWVPGAETPGVDREFEDEGIYMVNDIQTRSSLEQQFGISIIVFSF